VEKKNYAGNEFHWRVSEHSYENVKSSLKDLKKLRARADMKEGHGPKRMQKAVRM